MTLYREPTVTFELSGELWLTSDPESADFCRLIVTRLSTRKRDKGKALLREVETEVLEMVEKSGKLLAIIADEVI